MPAAEVTRAKEGGPCRVHTSRDGRRLIPTRAGRVGGTEGGNPLGHRPHQGAPGHRSRPAVDRGVPDGRATNASSHRHRSGGEHPYHQRLALPLPAPAPKPSSPPTRHVHRLTYTNPRDLYAIMQEQWPTPPPPIPCHASPKHVHHLRSQRQPKAGVRPSRDGPGTSSQPSEPSSHSHATRTEAKRAEEPQKQRSPEAQKGRPSSQQSRTKQNVRKAGRQKEDKGKGRQRQPGRTPAATAHKTVGRSGAPHTKTGTTTAQPSRWESFHKGATLSTQPAASGPGGPDRQNRPGGKRATPATTR